ncbi:MAG TPA: toll/interleukin-1 receptor domain-containing protein, partial [Sphingomicrobium sp.]|nr:toll/interleukin-1 receptor domain-containing protein [Sphingomicrobium sp.]
MGAVFLSYAREDAALARALAKSLQASGLEVWWDQQLQGGSEYALRIERELARCSAVVVLWSRHSVGSPWVRDEAAAGRDQGKLVPLSIDGKEPPIGFRQYHTVPLDEDLALAGKVPCEVLGAINAKLAATGGEAALGPASGADVAGDEPAAAAGRPHQEVRFCTAPDGVQLAYSCIGEGPPLVKAANWLNHLEFEWRSP